MNDDVELEILGTGKVRNDDGSPVITLPGAAIEKSDLRSAEYAVVATNSRSVFLVPSTVESIGEAIAVDEDRAVDR